MPAKNLNLLKYSSIILLEENKYKVVLNHGTGDA